MENFIFWPLVIFEWSRSNAPEQVFETLLFQCKELMTICEHFYWYFMKSRIICPLMANLSVNHDRVPKPTELEIKWNSFESFGYKVGWTVLPQKCWLQLMNPFDSIYHFWDSIIPLIALPWKIRITWIRAFQYWRSDNSFIILNVYENLHRQLFLLSISRNDVLFESPSSLNDTHKKCR